jgi:hypothetical protein
MAENIEKGKFEKKEGERMPGVKQPEKPQQGGGKIGQAHDEYTDVKRSDTGKDLNRGMGGTERVGSTEKGDVGKKL